MNILVCIKQVPGTDKVEIDTATGVLKRSGVAGKLNPYDLFGIEMALRLRKEYGGAVKAITMGPPQAKSSVLEAIRMGVDGGCVISDRKFAGSDVLATSYTLSQAIGKTGSFDLIICGKQSTDGATAQVGAELAEFLDIPHVSNVTEALKIENGSITVKIDNDSEFLTELVKLPCLICTDGDIGARRPSRRRMVSTDDEPAQEPVEFVSIADFADQDETHYGLSGSPTRVERIFPAEKETSREVLKGDSRELADRLFDELKRLKFL